MEYEIFTRTRKDEIDKAIKDVQKSGLYTKYKGDIEGYLGFNIERLQDRPIKNYQTKIVQEIINQVRITPNSIDGQTPVLAIKILWRNDTSTKFDEHLQYCGAIGWFNFLKKIRLPGITYTTHRWEIFYEYPRAPRGATVKILVKYIVVTKKYGLSLDPQKTKCLEVFRDSSFCGIWNNPTAPKEVITTK